MKRNQPETLVVYEAYREIVSRYLNRKIPGCEPAARKQLLAEIWREAAAKEKVFRRLGEKERICMLLALTDQIISCRKGRKFHC